MNDLKPPTGSAPTQPKVNITPEMMKSFKTLTCDCGGQLFEPGYVFKKISALVAPTGKEELYPIEVLICKKCGKVPNETNTYGMLPLSVLATPAKTAPANIEVINTPDGFKVENKGGKNDLKIVK